MTEKIKECFEHVAKYWKEEYYKGCYQDWKNIELFIVKYPTSREFKGYKCSCGTMWTDLKFINRIDNICPACDDSCEPFLSNPKNKDAVIQYIPEKYHKYIFTDLKELFHQYDDKDEVIDENKCDKCDKCDKECNPENRCDFCEEKYCDGCLPFNIYMVRCDACKTQWCIKYNQGVCEVCEKNTRRGQCIECDH